MSTAAELVATAPRAPCRRRPFLHIEVVPWVSSDLFLIAVDRREAMILARDVDQVDADRPRVYRRLDPEWYQWLHSQVRRAELAAKAGRIAQPSWDRLRERFNAIWTYARLIYGVDALARLHASDPDARYKPPALHVYGKPTAL